MLSNRHFQGYNSHPRLEGTHAFLSASNSAWVDWSDDQLVERLTTAQAAARGTSLHALAAHAIKEGIRFELTEENSSVLAAYVNDALDLEMIPEQMLFYSINAYGTADAISFEEYIDAVSPGPLGFLRIHDYKSGVTKTNERQLFVYAAYFCLEYGFKPFEIEGELRIYQEPEVKIWDLDRLRLARYMDKIMRFDQIIEESRIQKGVR